MRKGMSFVATAMAVALLAAGTAWADHGSHQGRGSEPRSGSPRKNQVVTEGAFYPMGGEGGKVFGSAKMIRHSRGTDLYVHAGGLEPDSPYEAHIHIGTCADMGSHYRHDPEGPEGPPNEIWPSSDPEDPRGGIRSDAGGYGNGEGHATWKARPEARSVMLHDGISGFMVSCADLH